ncbi:MAG: hypothetical protein ACRDNM_00160 [Gaiellaceae bacterium]
MPIPYAEPASDYNSPRPLVQLALAHAAGAAAAAAANKVQVFHNANAAPVVLTGVYQVVGSIAIPALTTAQRVLLFGSVAGDIAAALSGQMQMELVDSVSGVLVEPVDQSYPADGTGVSTCYVFALTPTLGAHTFTVQAKATGDSAPTVATGHGTLVVAVIG